MLNKIMLIGTLWGGPECEFTRSGRFVNRFWIAVTSHWKDPTSGERKEETLWFTCVAVGRLAESRQSLSLHKGAKVYVEGRMASHQYTGRDNVERTAWEVRLSDIQLLAWANSVPRGTRGPYGLPI